MSQIQGEFSALACPLPAPETRTQFKFSQHVSRNLGGVLPRKKGLGVNNAWSYSYGAMDSEDLRFDKGQIMSECIYEIIDFPNYHRKNLIDFYPGRFY